MGKVSSGAPSNQPTIYCSEHGNGYSIKTADLRTLWNVLGDELLINFLRAFVHVDRLTSLIDFWMQAVKVKSESEIRSRRNLHTVVWFMIGTLRELRYAVSEIKADLFKRDLSDCKSKAWEQLMALERRWNGKDYIALRSKAAFHIDKEKIRLGLKTLMGEGTPVSLIEMSRAAYAETSFPIGEDVLMRGMEMDDQKIDRIIQNVVKDLQACQKIEDAFIEVLQSLGCKFEER